MLSYRLDVTRPSIRAMQWTRGMNNATYLAVMISAVVIVLMPRLAFAVSYSVSPPLIDLELEKRDIIYKEITITNKDNRQIRVFPSVNEVDLDDNGQIEAFVEPSMQEDKSTAVTTWIQISRKRIDIKPGESVTVPVTIKVHPDVKPGEYHAIIGFGEGSNQPQAQSKVYNGIAPITVVRIGVDEVQNQFLRLERFNIDRFISEDPAGTIVYALNNPGKDPVTPGGEIIFYDNNGNEVSTIPVNPEGSTVAPGKSLEITDSVPSDLGLGKYKALLSVEYGEHMTASVHDTSFFYVMPLKQLLLIFGAVMLLAMLLAYFVHRRYAGGEEYYDDDMIADVPLYIRSDRSPEQHHDIDLSKKE